MKGFIRRLKKLFNYEESTYEVNLGVLPEDVTVDKFLKDFKASKYPQTQEGVNNFIKESYNTVNTIMGIKAKYKSKSISYEL
jgi:hypothetical protein